MLELKNVEFEILKEKIVKDFSLVLNYGETKTLFGPSGCGKTTILRIISKLEIPKKGIVVNKFKKISYLFQENRLLDNLTALDNVLLCMNKPDENLVLEHFNLVGLEKKDAYKYPYELSGGMAKRVSFMRAYLSGADLILLDEPFVGLDMDLRNILVNLLAKKLEEKSIACILVTHDRFEAVMMSDEVLFLSKKQAVVKNKVTFDTLPSKRDIAFIQKAVDINFKGVIYYD
ncbi:nitrate/sulfonate/bicarbonate ABC transporter, ATP-binding protein [Campylobacter blaseri]|uniref:ATP-binding cassette domain-containing protein n=1 Tax=Campylobacter blaseri TaxID=2042961 RepID=UPI00155DC90E|nr:ATP-binding cassette domain-containing protein [Campylobacter blaseri]QKF86979.1 nitrate/sulfonate/bicarbonate ABC transporter, ATP-binding protein [Campylobacter blaseri]